jgi:hypothetical protein
MALGLARCQAIQPVCLVTLGIDVIAFDARRSDATRADEVDDGADLQASCRR